jgi:hypothetical protein
MPVGYGVSDHRLFVVDFSTAAMIGTCPPKIVRPALRRLNTKIPGCALWYNRALQKNILRHRLLERMINVAKSHKSKETILAQLNQLDREGEQYMKHTEKKCRRIKSGCIPFPPEASLWIRQCQVYRSLLRWHAGKIRNQGNLKGTTRSCWIEAPFFLSVEELKLQLKICKQKFDYYRKHGNGIANNTLTNVWRQQRIGRIMKQNGKSLPSYDEKKIDNSGEG